MKVSIQLALSLKEFNISISDFSKGLQINHNYHPSPKTMINKVFDFNTTLDGKVKARIINQWNTELIHEDSEFEEKNKSEILSNIRGDGRGLSIMIKIIDSVRFKYSKNQKNTLTLSKSL